MEKTGPTIHPSSPNYFQQFKWCWPWIWGQDHQNAMKLILRPSKWGQDHHNLFKSSHCPSDVSIQVWPKSINWFSSQSAHKLIFVKIWQSLKMRSTKSNKLLRKSKWYISSKFDKKILKGMILESNEHSHESETPPTGNIVHKRKLSCSGANPNWFCKQVMYIGLRSDSAVVQAHNLWSLEDSIWHKGHFLYFFHPVGKQMFPSTSGGGVGGGHN